MDCKNCGKETFILSYDAMKILLKAYFQSVGL